MRRWALVLVASVASADPRALAPRPIDDLTPFRTGAEADLRWPLDRDPLLAPRYDIANHACTDKPGGQLGSYLRGWCAEREQRPRDALPELRDAAAGRGAKLAEAARADLVDVLAEAYFGDPALAWLTSNNLVEPALLDRLATTYVLRGDLMSASVIDKQLAARPKDHDATCHRNARRAREQSTLLADDKCPAVELQACPLATGAYPSGTWTTADELAALAKVDLADCGSLRWRDSRVEAQAHVWLVALAARWPAHGAPADWLAMAAAATRSWRTAEVEAFALDAIDNAIAAGSCDASELHAAAEVALALKDHADHDPSTDAHITAIGALTPEHCRAYP